MKSGILFVLLFLTSCAGYVDNFHRQIDREERGGRPSAKAAPRDKNYWRDRYRREYDKRPIKDPITYSLNDGGPSGGVRPPVKRNYRPQRYRADDFRDSSDNGSLWANQGSSASLFTYQNDKQAGDIVIINVLENLRNQISAELKRTFPDKPKMAKAGDKPAKADPKAPPAPAATPAAEEMDMKVYDKISGTVMEEINQDYILLRGRKEVIFKKEKRSIEVQALVSRKDIMENDYVNSDKLLESRVFVLGEKR